jgi:hypothetical protein
VQLPHFLDGGEPAHVVDGREVYQAVNVGEVGGDGAGIDVVGAAVTKVEGVDVGAGFVGGEVADLAGEFDAAGGVLDAKAFLGRVDGDGRIPVFGDSASGRWRSGHGIEVVREIDPIGSDEGEAIGEGREVGRLLDDESEVILGGGKGSRSDVVVVVADRVSGIPAALFAGVVVAGADPKGIVDGDVVRADGGQEFR